ncbi:MAG: 50S ribosomal protein L20 [Candidatus Amesbacteria bacterium GW2011_GWA2_47_11b]|uniref:Large ribosomal subunit protein bL20 n=2 Tax=Candidatus Amesiibacteriota TaxID=1752730 RepID=A0A0G1UTN0_9BACT|nr:MAG: 50S ribosomal protein L20 [Microgenomates group bacterium GW2011_GWC1_46_20]KKU57826.1 MAG: 50S ribosomal protein L20 [Candidatus Amesbacteria bacterium GW2011_GWA2_47_11b]KKU69398.1 MAG: 50S ribosomal protein L20 [Candidatus Amesbacteria bacterium GW2011_GWA1_47_20]
MRVKSPRRQRHNKVLKLAKGYRMTRHRLYKVAREATIHAGQYAFAGRHLRRRDLRATWIIRLNAALRSLGVTYSKFIPALKKANIGLDRKILADLAIRQPETLKEIVKKAGFTLPK